MVSNYKMRHLSVFLLTLLLLSCVGTSTKHQKNSSLEKNINSTIPKKIESIDAYENYIIKTIQDKNEDEFKRNLVFTDLKSQITKNIGKKPTIEQKKIVKKVMEIFGAYTPSIKYFDWKYINNRKEGENYYLNFRISDENEALFFCSLRLSNIEQRYMVTDIMNYNLGVPISHYFSEIIKLF